MTGLKKFTVVLSGSTGFVGTRLKEVLFARGWNVICLARKDFESSSHDLARKIEGAGAIINLAGAPIIQRWTAGYKQVLYDSRIRVTEQLVKACAHLEEKPDLFISTSAIGLYADQEHHTENNFVQADNF